MIEQKLQELAKRLYKHYDRELHLEAVKILNDPDRYPPSLPEFLPKNPQVLSLQRQVMELQKALEHIAEYWNRDQNEQAMTDACWKVIEIAEEALKGVTTQ